MHGWAPAPLVLAGAAVALILFVRGWLRLRRRGRADRAGVDRLLLFAGGLALVVLPLVSPLDGVAETRSLAAHMLQHVLIGDAGPALLLLAVRGPLLAFVLPAAAVRFVAGTPRLHVAVGTLGRPAVALGVWIAAIAAWHVPVAYDAALAHPLLHDLEHATFVIAGLLVWWQLVDPPHRGRLSVAGRAGLAGMVFFAGQALCEVLLFSPAPLYAAYANEHLADQQYAGLVMGAEQLVTLGTCVALLGVSFLRSPRQPRLA
jgi:putative membrane protein